MCFLFPFRHGSRTLVVRWCDVRTVTDGTLGHLSLSLMCLSLPSLMSFSCSFSLDLAWEHRTGSPSRDHRWGYNECWGTRVSLTWVFFFLFIFLLFSERVTGDWFLRLCHTYFILWGFSFHQHSIIGSNLNLIWSFQGLAEIGLEWGKRTAWKRGTSHCALLLGGWLLILGAFS